MSEVWGEVVVRQQIRVNQWMEGGGGGGGSVCSQSGVGEGNVSPSLSVPQAMPSLSATFLLSKVPRYLHGKYLPRTTTRTCLTSHDAEPGGRHEDPGSLLLPTCLPKYLGTVSTDQLGCLTPSWRSIESWAICHGNSITLNLKWSFACSIFYWINSCDFTLMPLQHGLLLLFLLLQALVSPGFSIPQCKPSDASFPCPS